MRLFRFLLLCVLLPRISAAATIEADVAFERGAPPAVLIWLPEDSAWKPTEPVVVDQKDQAFSPIIAVAPPGGVVRFTNSDALQHNVFAIDDTQKIDTDLGLAAPGSTLSLTVSWPAGAMVRHGCKIHPQMQLWIASLSTSYHAVVAIPEGQLTATLRLDGVPAGLTRVALWAPRIEPVETAEARVPLLRRGKPAGTLTVRRRP